MSEYFVEVCQEEQDAGAGALCVGRDGETRQTYVSLQSLFNHIIFIHRYSTLTLACLIRATHLPPLFQLVRK